jgi:hypothetical protein
MNLDLYFIYGTTLPWVIPEVFNFTIKTSPLAKEVVDNALALALYPIGEDEGTVAEASSVNAAPDLYNVITPNTPAADG